MTAGESRSEKVDFGKRKVKAQGSQGLAGRRIFVGRERELEELREALSETFLNRGRLLLIRGESGIGKTHLVDELAESAAEDGAQVLRGQCWEQGGAPAFWPWVQVIRAYLRNCGAETLRSDLAWGAGALAQLIPEIRSHLSDLVEIPQAALSDPDQARFVLFDSIATLLRNAASRKPLLLVLDALHAADPSSLQLLRFLARDFSSSRILTVGVYRDVEVRREPAVARLLADLAADGRQISLRGLPEAEVALFMELVAGTKPARDVAIAVHRATQGNPLFVDEITRLLVSEGRLGDSGATGQAVRLGIPERLRDVVCRRLEPLSEEARHVLEIASAIGREFDIGTLRSLGGLGAENLLERIQEARSAGLLSEVAGSSGRFAFSHGLVAEILYEDLSPALRLKLDSEIGEALEGSYALDPSSRLPVLAHHFFRHATLGGDPDKAILYSSRAARRATSVLAYEEAVAHYERALQALDLKSSVDDRDRCGLLLELGEARSKAGDLPNGKAAFLQAAAVARKLGTVEELAKSALGFAGPFLFIPSASDAQAQSLLEEALRALSSEDRLLRVQLLARLALGLYFSDEGERRDALSCQALEMARRLRDSGTLAAALTARHIAVWRPENLEERLASATEAVRLAEEIGDPELLVRSYALKIIDLMEAGDIGALDRAIESHSQLAEQLREPLHLWQSNWFRATRAFLAGSFDEAERLARRALSLAESAQGRHGIGTVKLQVLTLRWHQGRLPLEELEDTVDRLAEQHLKVPTWRCAMIHMYRDVGRDADARREFEALAASDFADLPRDSTWLSGLALLAEYCAAMGDARRAATLYDLLLPYAERNIVTAYAIVCYGSASRHLGLLATTMSRWEAAEKHFEDAIAMNARMGAEPLAATTGCSYAEMLLARGGRGDRAKALRLLEQVLAAARDLGMVKLVEKVLTLKEGAPARSAMDLAKAEQRPPVADLEAAAAERVFRKDGRYWTIVYRDRDLRVRDTKGMRYLAHLLRYPGREFHVADLAARIGVSARMAAEVPAAEIAYSPGVDGGEGSLQVRGERKRKGAPSSERIRKAVTNRIRDSIARIQEQHPILGSHLLGAVRTGRFCSYAPNRETPWVV